MKFRQLHVSALLTLVTTLGSLPNAQALEQGLMEGGYWGDQVTIGMPIYGNRLGPYTTTTGVREGNEYLGFDRKWHTNTPLDNSVVRTATLSDHGVEYYAYAEGATSISQNRVKAAVSTTGFLNSSHGTPYAQAGGSWSDKVTIWGGVGDGIADYRSFLHLAYEVDPTANSVLHNAAQGFATFTFRIYDPMSGADMASGGFNFGIGNAGGGVCQLAFGSAEAQPCSGEETFAELGKFNFTYGKEFYVRADLGVTVWTDASIDAMHTAGFSSFTLPEGATMTYASGRTDNPLNATALAPVPEPETYAMMLAGIALVGASVRRRLKA